MSATNPSAGFSLLIYGPEHCGKYFMGTAIMGEIPEVQQMGFVKLHGSGLLEKPESVANIARVLSQCERRFALIEDIDLLIEELRHFPSARRAMLEMLSKSPITVIGTARYPDKLRPEELDSFRHIVPMGYPNDEDRRELLEHVLGGNCRKFVPNLVARTKWWSTLEILVAQRHVRFADRG